MNVLVYGGRGVGTESLYQTTRSLRQQLAKQYDVQVISADGLAKEPWESTCLLLVVPGGRDAPYVEDLSGRAMDRIKRWILAGRGKYLGICAGAYFGCDRFEFEVHRERLAMCGGGRLGLFGGLAKGAVFGPFEYNSELGAKAAVIAVNGVPPRRIPIYFNGGCTFDDFTPQQGEALTFKVVATYEEENRFGKGSAAIIGGYMQDGSSASVILSGVHIEYDAKEMLSRDPVSPVASDLLPFEGERRSLWRDVLSLLGLKVAAIGEAPSAGGLSSPEESVKLVYGREDRMGRVFMVNTNESSKDQMPFLRGPAHDQFGTDKSSFDIDKYYGGLRTDRIGTGLIYAERINSTQTFLLEHYRIAEAVPDGTILLAGEQLAGRGRGKNSWVSSLGCLQFTMVLRHGQPKDIVLVQYLVGIAMIEGIRKLCDLKEDENDEKLLNNGVNEQNVGDDHFPLRLKWPNDLYTVVGGEENKKLGGILVNSQTCSDQFILLIGMGTNIFDTPWTRSLSDLSPLLGRTFTKESVLSSFCNTFEQMYDEFLLRGFPFQLYYKYWMHSGQMVFLEVEQTKAIIEGIDHNGFLKVRSVDKSGQPKTFLLQPDGNSFDMMKNLIRRK